MAKPDKQAPLISYLENLASRDDSLSRANLARLRKALQPGHELEALSIVLPYLDKSPRSEHQLRRQEDDAILLASLFAMHPESGSLTLAQAMRQVATGDGSESIAGRFRALLSANREELPTHLRNAVSLVASRNKKLDWQDLLTALQRWDLQDSFARRKWAREFWSDEPEAPADDASQSTQNETT